VGPRGTDAHTTCSIRKPFLEDFLHLRVRHVFEAGARLTRLDKIAFVKVGTNSPPMS
jgi:hypothetical protein